MLGDGEGQRWSDAESNCYLGEGKGGGAPVLWPGLKEPWRLLSFHCFSEPPFPPVGEGDLVLIPVAGGKVKIDSKEARIKNKVLSKS